MSHHLLLVPPLPQPLLVLGAALEQFPAGLGLKGSHGLIYRSKLRKYYKFALLWGEAQMCLPYACCLRSRPVTPNVVRQSVSQLVS